MKGSLIIVSFFVVGLVLSYFGFVPELLCADSLITYALYGLMFFVGISIGSDIEVLRSVRGYGWRILLVPLATIVGTLLGAALVGVFYGGRTVLECMAVGAGFGYYSLSSIFITEYVGAELGTVALVSNIMREIMALIFAPILALYFGKLAPIAAGGATTADTTLPIISKVSGSDFVVIAIFHGVVVDFSVTILVPFICRYI